MKSKDLFILLSHIDEKYIVESAEKPEFHRRRPIRKAIVIAAAVIFCLAMCTTVLAVTPLGEMLFGNISLSEQFPNTPENQAQLNSIIQQVDTVSTSNDLQVSVSEAMYDGTFLTVVINAQFNEKLADNVSSLSPFFNLYSPKYSESYGIKIGDEQMPAGGGYSIIDTALDEENNTVSWVVIFPLDGISQEDTLHILLTVSGFHYHDTEKQKTDILYRGNYKLEFDVDRSPYIVAKNLANEELNENMSVTVTSSSLRFELLTPKKYSNEELFEKVAIVFTNGEIIKFGDEYYDKTFQTFFGGSGNIYHTDTQGYEMSIYFKNILSAEKVRGIIVDGIEYSGIDADFDPNVVNHGPPYTYSIVNLAKIEANGETITVNNTTYRGEGSILITVETPSAYSKDAKEALFTGNPVIFERFQIKKSDGTILNFSDFKTAYDTYVKNQNNIYVLNSVTELNAESLWVGLQNDDWSIIIDGVEYEVSHELKGNGLYASVDELLS